MPFTHSHPKGRKYKNAPPQPTPERKPKPTLDETIAASNAEVGGLPFDEPDHPPMPAIVAWALDALEVQQTTRPGWYPTDIHIRRKVYGGKPCYSLQVEWMGLGGVTETAEAIKILEA